MTSNPIVPFLKFLSFIPHENSGNFKSQQVQYKEVLLYITLQQSIPGLGVGSNDSKDKRMVSGDDVTALCVESRRVHLPYVCH